MRLDLRRLAVHSGGRLLAAFGIALLAALVLAPDAPAYRNFDSNSSHNFVDNGFTGGGVCSECHAAGGGAADNRLFRWDYGGSDPAMCQNKCHGAVPSLPLTDPGWATVTGVTPIPAPHSCVNGRCAYCHNGEVSFCNCLDCHQTGLSDTLLCRTPQDFDSGSTAQPVQTEVAKFFPGITGFTPMSGLLSSHNVKYDAASGSLCSSANNECLKCHGGSEALHPGVGIVKTPVTAATKEQSAILVYPDDPDGAGPLVRGNPIISPDLTTPKVTDAAAWNAFYLEKRQLFCLSCHDGRVDQVGADITLNGASVPPVPRYNYNSGAPYTTGIPYFADTGETDFANKNYFESNGHGISADTRSLPMNLTCLGEEVKPKEASNGGTTGITVGAGCHSVHGTANYSLIRDAAAAGTVDLGTGVNTAEEMASAVCLGCHDRGAMRLFGTGFHVWMGNKSTDRMIHLDGTCDSVNTNSSVFWRMLPPASATRPGNNMGTGTPATLGSIMPFFNTRTSDLKTGRIYGTQSFDSVDCVQTASSSGSVVNCLTCHEAHGTFSHYQQGDSTSSTPGSYGMVRLPTTDMDYDDELCGQCHVP